MAEPPLHRDRDQHGGAEPSRESSTGIPRWVKVLGIVLAVAVLLLVVVLLVGGGNHGPSRHSAPGSVIEYGATGAFDHHRAQEYEANQA